MPDASQPSDSKKARRRLPEAGYKLLRGYWTTNPTPEKPQRDRLLSELTALPGCEWYDSQKLSCWFNNRRPLLKPINTTATASDSAAEGISESPVTPSMTPVPSTPGIQHGTTAQVSPLTPSQLEKLSNLSETITWPPPPNTVKAWAKVIEADINDVGHWVSSQQPQGTTSTSANANPNSHLPTPSESTSPEPRSPWMGGGTREFKYELLSPLIDTASPRFLEQQQSRASPSSPVASTSTISTAKRPRPAPEYAEERIGPPSKRRVASSATSNSAKATTGAATRRVASASSTSASAKASGKAKATITPPVRSQQTSMSTFRLNTALTQAGSSSATDDPTSHPPSRQTSVPKVPRRSSLAISTQHPRLSKESATITSPQASSSALIAAIPTGWEPLPPTYLALATPLQGESSSATATADTVINESITIAPSRFQASTDPVTIPPPQPQAPEALDEAAEEDSPMDTAAAAAAEARAYTDALMSTIAQALASVSVNPIFRDEPKSGEEFIKKYELFEDSFKEVWKKWGPPPGDRDDSDSSASS